MSWFLAGMAGAIGFTGAICIVRYFAISKKLLRCESKLQIVKNKNAKLQKDVEMAFNYENLNADELASGFKQLSEENNSK